MMTVWWCREGQVYEGVVVKTQPFGAFVEIPGFKQHGMVHISQLSETKVNEVEDVVSKGQRVFVKVLETKRVDGKDRVSLSMKVCACTPPHLHHCSRA